MAVAQAERERIPTQARRGEDTPVILIVDDTPLNRDLVSRILRNEGFRTLGAASGEEALRLCTSTRVDLILLDVMMPDRSGFQVCSDLKSMKEASDIPVIFLWALDDLQNRLKGLHVGGVDYISKPFHVEEILARTRVHLRIRRAMQRWTETQRAHLEELRQAQQSMLVNPEDVPEACFAVHYSPLDTVSGDIYDVLPLADDLISYFVADISGHGVGASFLTSAVKALLRQYSTPMYSPEDTMRGINAVMHATLTNGNYLTACYARLYKRRRMLAVVSAGHPPFIHVANGKATSVRVESDPLGVFGSVVLQKREVNVSSGDRFFLYTDGLIESAQSPGGGRQAGLEQLREACEHRHGLALDEAVHAIVGDLKQAGQPAEDDLLLGVEVKL
jgi:phosphoserine phosphatase RsbU/P